MPSEQPDPIITFGGSVASNQPIRLYSTQPDAKTVHLFENTYDLTKPSDRQALKNIAKGILDVL